jgi:hypothetical protein
MNYCPTLRLIPDYVRTTTIGAELPSDQFLKEPDNSSNPMLDQSRKYLEEQLVILLEALQSGHGALEFDFMSAHLKAIQEHGGMYLMLLHPDTIAA